MNNLKIDGINVIDYEGKGLPFVFIHAFPLCSRMWDSQAEYFKDKYRVILYDVRGLGYSYEETNIQFTMEDLVDDLYKVINELKLGKIIACGLSMGGYIVLRALQREQERFLAAILADTKSEGETNESLLARSEMIKRLNSGDRTVLDEFLKKLLSETGYNNIELREFVKKMTGWMETKGIIAALLAIATRTNTRYQLKNISVPVLAIAGKDDIITPPIHSFLLREYMQNAEMKIIRNAGHLSNMESPDEFNKTVENFLKNKKLL